MFLKSGNPVSITTFLILPDRDPMATTSNPLSRSLLTARKEYRHSFSEAPMTSVFFEDIFSDTNFLYSSNPSHMFHTFLKGTGTQTTMQFLQQSVHWLLNPIPGFF